jgi:hypothetical protein
MKTIVYVTSNQEDEKFEKHIVEDLLSKSEGIPIISVSQKPMELGKNICVGDVGVSYINYLRQYLIGITEAQTKYIINAESDFLYDKEYFGFTPEHDGIHRHSNVWILHTFLKNDGFGKKGVSEGAQICDRETLLKRLEVYLEHLPKWHDGVWEGFRRLRMRPPFHRYPITTFETKYPCISFKTGKGLRRYTALLPNIPKVNKLPFWGTEEEVLRRMECIH